MKLHEITKQFYGAYGNAKAVLKVKTESIQLLFGDEYDGEVIRYGGVIGHIADIPAFLGDYDVLDVEQEQLPERKVTITI